MLSTSHKGAIAELAAAQWLLAQGFEVFRNVSAAGPADLVAWNVATGQTLLIDVKAITAPFVRADGQFSTPSRETSPHGVHCLFVVRGEVLGFARRRSDGKGAEIYDPFAP